MYSCTKIIDIYELIRYRLLTSLRGLFVNSNKLFELDSLKFKFPKSSLHSYGTNFQHHEEVEREFISKYLDPKDSVLELGGSIGVISCLTNSILENKKNHVVVEPNKIAQDFLLFNRKTNNCKFSIESSIIDNKETRVLFYVTNDFVSSSIYSKNLRGYKQEYIDCISFDDFIKKHKISFNTLIMDIEGHEFNFISENNLKFFEKIIIEFHPLILGENKVNHCKKMLINQSFNLIEKNGQVEYWKRVN